MNRLLTPWAQTGIAAMCGGMLALYATCPDCIDRIRVNTACEWNGDSPFRIDSQNALHQKHLVADAQLSEELAIRHADAEFGRRFGVEHHGGLIDNGRFRLDCLSRMFKAIEENHAVTPEQIRSARAHRNRSFDFAVAILFLPLYAVGAAIVCGRLVRRFASDGGYVRFIAAAMASVTVSALGLQLFRLWGAVWEAIRVGNGHMTGMRAASYNRWTQHYAGVDFIFGLLLCGFIALLCFRVAPREPHTQATSTADL